MTLGGHFNLIEEDSPSCRNGLYYLYRCSRSFYAVACPFMPESQPRQKVIYLKEQQESKMAQIPIKEILQRTYQMETRKGHQKITTRRPQTRRLPNFRRSKFRKSRRPLRKSLGQRPLHKEIRPQVLQCRTTNLRLRNLRRKPSRKERGFSLRLHNSCARKNTMRP